MWPRHSLKRTEYFDHAIRIRIKKQMRLDMIEKGLQNGCNN